MRFQHGNMTRPSGRLARLRWRLGTVLNVLAGELRCIPNHPVFPFIIIGAALAALLLLSIYNL